MAEEVPSLPSLVVTTLNRQLPDFLPKVCWGCGTSGGLSEDSAVCSPGAVLLLRDTSSLKNSFTSMPLLDPVPLPGVPSGKRTEKVLRAQRVLCAPLAPGLLRLQRFRLRVMTPMCLSVSPESDRSYEGQDHFPLVSASQMPGPALGTL